ncbi:MAG: bifunctional adenosylcobinamide kinase/adenosylcobinamide-phosphate guanylyltransferase [Acidimicrobiia bacterium]|nr:bifunctional adenosylcobinamide kinase/adenosylcobinamide-phosphate guanylyltransferase [Acidimicrobiia bacterium]MYJ15149.1 bifunctional adenosylcobinamide kinase/adenosylcobinamide-phosphate guanylyltransferase [Acidimicrobiia bacterium]
MVPVKGDITFILGGARSGKSTAAERLARRGDRVLFVATAEALDEEMERRIRIHRQERPTEWDTLEEPRALVSALQPRLAHYDVFLVDCITVWVSNLLLAMDDYPDAERRVVDETRRLLDLMQDSHAAWIVVSNEVGMGIVPASPLGRVFRDALGRVNQIIAARSSRVLLMVAGLSFEAPLYSE